MITIEPTVRFQTVGSSLLHQRLIGMTNRMSDDREHQRLRDQYAEIAALAGGLAHEIRNPLSTISMNLELLAEELTEESSPRNRRMLTKLQSVQGECERLEIILNEFLKFASAGELQRTKCDINELVDEFIDFYQAEAQEHSVDIRLHPASDLPDVYADPTLMRQVFHNLAQNAQQAMPAGGVLEIQTALEDGRVLLSFIDNGVGMAEKTRAKMFEVFFSLRSGGSGLGLPTVRKIIRAHGGDIRCDSDLGRGTRFTILLPSATD